MKLNIQHYVSTVNMTLESSFFYETSNPYLVKVKKTFKNYFNRIFL